MWQEKILSHKLKGFPRKIFFLLSNVKFQFYLLTDVVRGPNIHYLSLGLSLSFTLSLSLFVFLFTISLSLLTLLISLYCHSFSLTLSFYNLPIFTSFYSLLLTYFLLPLYPFFLSPSFCSSFSLFGEWLRSGWEDDKKWNH